ncbi:uncharacterized protein LOC125648676 isoform X2 [Ostrea edulis]|uniref:uncharacterized protein LOC125648676 isoform X2 n=1 Tax=Ostrea edulis TaxID=37623 RepID=UPI0024AF184D|nr:uncharacterized protein LOC125648676 isoform X2 [Ostrea edulis]
MKNWRDTSSRSKHGPKMQTFPQNRRLPMHGTKWMGLARTYPPLPTKPFRVTMSPPSLTQYFRRYPAEACNLLKYCAYIREINRLHVDEAWRGYDETFRKLRESSLLPWQQPVPELRLRVAAMGPKFSDKSHPPYAKKSNFRPQKVCFAYNRGDKCSVFPCKYVHVCQNVAIDIPEQSVLLNPSPSHTNHPVPLPIPVKPAILRKELLGYDSNKSQYLVEGFCRGFRLGCVGAPSQLC